MEARIVRGTPRTSLKGNALWQLETRLRVQSEWVRLFGRGRTSTDPAKLRRGAKMHGWSLIDDKSQA